MREFCLIFVSIHLTIICHYVSWIVLHPDRWLYARSTFPDSTCPLRPTPLHARNAGLSVLKCQATDKPKALILRRGPHRGGGPWTLSRLIQLCYNPLPTRPFQPPLGALSLSPDTLGLDLRRATVEGRGRSCWGRERVAEAEHAFVSNPVYDRGHTAAYPSPQSSFSAR